MMKRGAGCAFDASWCLRGRTAIHLFRALSHDELWYRKRGLSRPQRIAVIVNPHARLVRRTAALAPALRAEAEGRASVHTTESLEELEAVCRELHAAETELVVIAGGDGSLMAGVTALSRAYGRDALPAVAPIGGGTVATIARNWGIDPVPVPTLRRLLRRPRRSTPRSSLQVTATGEAPRIGFIVGTGLVASFFDEYYRRDAPGYQGAAKMVARIFAESFFGGPLARAVLEPMPCTLEADGEPLTPEAWSLVCAAAVPNLGIGMRVTYRAEDDPERIHLVASPLRPRQLGPRAPFVLAGRSIGGPGHVDRLVSSFAIGFPDGGRYVLDGELLEATRLQVRPGPRLRVMTAT